ncbi:MAG: NAD(P) transhydrogenase subunit alpha [Cyclobacteriaceae bacterium]
MQLGVLKSNSTPLTALVPSLISKYQKEGFEVFIEAGSGSASYFDDKAYLDAGAQILSRKEILSNCDAILVDSDISDEEINKVQHHALVIGKFNTLSNPGFAKELKGKKAQIFSLDLVPRSSIAQSMDVLSSLASLAGYKAVVVAANLFPGYFPMMTTAAGTVPPAKVLVLGAGVAGLQAIATAKRLGASVEAFDVRSAVKEEVESLGAKFIEVAGSKEDAQAGGYAITQSEEYVQKQRELINDRASKSDVVITTANIPGRKAPLLIEKGTVEQMKAGSVIIDLASASGGNCELSENDKEITVGGVKILGDSKLFHSLPSEASRLYSTNIYNFIKFVIKDGMDNVPYDHEIVQKTLVSERINHLTI